MEKTRRSFLKLAGAADLGIAGRNLVKNSPSLPGKAHFPETHTSYPLLPDNIPDISPSDGTTSIVGSYGQWAAGFTEKQLPLFSFRKDKWRNIEKWRRAAKKKVFRTAGNACYTRKAPDYDHQILHI